MSYQVRFRLNDHNSWGKVGVGQSFNNFQIWLSDSFHSSGKDGEHIWGSFDLWSERCDKNNRKESEGTHLIYLYYTNCEHLILSFPTLHPLFSHPNYSSDISYRPRTIKSGRLGKQSRRQLKRFIATFLYPSQQLSPPFKTFLSNKMNYYKSQLLSSVKGRESLDEWRYAGWKSRKCEKKLAFFLSRMEPFPLTMILHPVSCSSCFAVIPRGPSILPTKLNCNIINGQTYLITKPTK